MAQRVSGCGPSDGFVVSDMATVVDNLVASLVGLCCGPCFEPAVSDMATVVDSLVASLVDQSCGPVL